MHVPEPAPTPNRPTTKEPPFAALRVPGARTFLWLMALVMMADSIEHVISYWVIFRRFDSPALAGFAVVSHWVPFLLFSIPVGALADRFDPRRIIQIGMALFMLASIGWAVLILIDGLEQWHAAVLLVIHGLAGVFWSPVAQVLLHDIVKPAQLPSAIRLFAMARVLGVLLGPMIGGVMLLVLAPWLGLLLNALIYLPALLWLAVAPYGPKFRNNVPKPKVSLRGFSDIRDAVRAVAADPTLLSMTALAGAASFFLGQAYQALLPAFAADLGHGASSSSYSILLGASAAGAMIGGVILEWRGLLLPRPRTAFVLVALWCVSLGGFAVTTNFILATILLFAAGFLFLAFSAMTQALVQIHAPPEIRGRVIGLYSVSALGLMSFSGVTVGIGGSLIGIHWSLGLSAGALFIFTLLLAPMTLRAKPAAAG